MLASGNSMVSGMYIDLHASAPYAQTRSAYSLATTRHADAAMHAPMHANGNSRGGTACPHLGRNNTQLSAQHVTGNSRQETQEKNLEGTVQEIREDRETLGEVAIGNSSGNPRGHRAP